MSKIEITAAQARDNVAHGKKGLNEAREKLTREIEIASRGLMSNHNIPINKASITENEAKELCFELVNLGFRARILDLKDFHHFEVSWHESK